MNRKNSPAMPAIAAAAMICGCFFPAGGRAAAADEGPLMHWPLAADAQAAAGAHHGDARGVQFRTVDGHPSAVFDGADAEVVIPADALKAVGSGDFTLTAWINAPADADEGNMDIASTFDPESSRGFHLALLNNSGTCTSMANTRNLFFGIGDHGVDGRWVDHGRPGNAMMIWGLATFDGDLYAATYEARKPDDRGHVYRLRGGEWEDCGAPDVANAITALAVHDGRLYAASSRYNATGSLLPLSENRETGGRVYQYDGGQRWIDCGRAGPGEFNYGLISFDGHLYATNMDSPNPQKRTDFGLFRHDGGQSWTYCGSPGGRVAALAVNDGKLYATGMDGHTCGGVYLYEGGDRWSEVGTPPGVTQTYSIAFPDGVLHVGTWPQGTVWRLDAPGQWKSAGRLGEEEEVMGLLDYNGALYGGTLPLAQVYRHLGGEEWRMTGRLDFTEVTYRRAWALGVFDGALFCGVLPSGNIFSYRSGQTVSDDRALGAGWHHVAAVREGGRVALFVDGELAGASEGEAIDASGGAPLRIGRGRHGGFNGAIRDVRIYDRALTPATISEFRATSGVGR